MTGSTVFACPFIFAAVVTMVFLPYLDATVVCGDWRSIDIVNNRTYFLATNASRDLAALEQMCRQVDPGLHVLYSVSLADEQAIANHPAVKNNMQQGVSTKIWTGYMSRRLASPYWLDGSPVNYINTLVPMPGLTAPCTYLEVNSAGLVTWGEAPCSDPLDFFCVMDDPPAVASSCPTNYTAHEGGCYRYEAHQTSDYSQAEAACAAEGAEVAGADGLQDMLVLARGVCVLSSSCLGWVSGVNETIFSVTGSYECCRTLNLTSRDVLAAPFTHTPCSALRGFFCKIAANMSNPRQNPPCITTTRRQSNYTFPPTADYALFLKQSIPAYVTPVTITIGSTGLIFIVIGILAVCLTDVPKLYTDIKTKMVVNCKEKCRTPDDEVEKDSVTPM